VLGGAQQGVPNRRSRPHDQIAYRQVNAAADRVLPVPLYRAVIVRDGERAVAGSINLPFLIFP
jgi:hypothetical protein